MAHDRVLDCQVSVDVLSNNFIMPSGLSVGAWEARVLQTEGGRFDPALTTTFNERVTLLRPWLARRTDSSDVVGQDD